jgi:myosin heavy subunit
VERSYHIFYQLMQQAVPDLKEKCRLSNDIYDYHYVSQVRRNFQAGLKKTTTLHPRGIRSHDHSST